VEGVKAARFMLVAVVVFSSIVVEANECVAPKPPKISGALCGRLFDSTGAAVPNVGLQVLGEADRVVADFQADSKGDFVFPNLGKGKYRLKATSSGWLIEFGQFEIVRSKAVCTSPVTVRLDVACCCFGSGITKKRPRRY
jgi:hypothetical protein